MRLRTGAIREKTEKRGLGRVFFRLSFASWLISCRIARDVGKKSPLPVLSDARLAASGDTGATKVV
ncbi:hypothetical protein [Cupriavidus sp. RAF12]|uniref:hypothetical protein n=1 Tax=Cupriavidus sp. RAF12 TaxID=3233050 RepID=UPI003F8F9FE8